MRKLEILIVIITILVAVWFNIFENTSNSESKKEKDKIDKNITSNGNIKTNDNLELSNISVKGDMKIDKSIKSDNSVDNSKKENKVEDNDIKNENENKTENKREGLELAEVKPLIESAEGRSKEIIIEVKEDTKREIDSIDETVDKKTERLSDKIYEKTDKLKENISNVNSNIHVIDGKYKNDIKQIRRNMNDDKNIYFSIRNNTLDMLDNNISYIEKTIEDNNSKIYAKLDNNITRLENYKVEIENTTEKLFKTVNDNLSLLRKETDNAITLVRNETDNSLEAIRTTTNTSIDIIHNELINLQTIVGNNTNKINVIENKLVEASKVGIGSIVWSITLDCPNGYIPMRGVDISDNIYSELRDTIELYILPNYQDLFLRVDNPNDSRNIGTFQDDSTAVNGLITGGVSLDSNANTGDHGSFERFVRHNAMIDFARGYGYGLESPYDENYKTLRGDAETRPKNVNLTLCIKYR